METLLLLGQGEPLYEQLSSQGLLGKLARWPNLHVAQISSRDHMFRALWLQREVYAALDAALERMGAPQAAEGLAATQARDAPQRAARAEQEQSRA